MDDRFRLLRSKGDDQSPNQTTALPEHLISVILTLSQRSFGVHSISEVPSLPWTLFLERNVRSTVISVGMPAQSIATTQTATRQNAILRLKFRLIFWAELMGWFAGKRLLYEVTLSADNLKNQKQTGSLIWFSLLLYTQRVVEQHSRPNQSTASAQQNSQRNLFDSTIRQFNDSRIRQLDSPIYLLD